ncbi:MAG: ABC transporter substrate-binding protein [Bacteroidaceae bacterium]|nr:ABC transporter substrate-binding protein [Bacteroidaceae bacterium]
MRKLFYTFVTMMMVTALFATFVGCNKKVTTVEVVDSTALRIAVLPTMDCLPFYVAKKCGLFDSVGVKVNLITFQAAMDADTAFCNNRVDGNVTDLVKACIWRGAGDSIKLVLANDLQLYLITAKQARIRSVESLKEKIIALTRNSSVDFVADRILESVKLGSEELNKPQINNIALRAQMTDQNQYDGAILPEPFASMSVQNGGYLVTSSAKLKNVNPLLALVFHEQILKERKQDVALVVNAYNQAVELINKNANEDAQRFLNYIPTQNEVPDSIIELPTFKPAMLPNDSILLAAKNWARKRTLLRQDFLNGALIDSSFVK